MPFKVLVDDNFHHMDESERYELGQFPTFAEALAASRGIVDKYLIAEFKPGMTSQALYASYTAFGGDPFIVPMGSEDEDHEFSAWGYAQCRCDEMCSPAAAQPAPSPDEGTKDGGHSVA
jgi:hypothetical protein